MCQPPLTMAAWPFTCTRAQGEPSSGEAVGEGYQGSWEDLLSWDVLGPFTICPEPQFPL